MLSNNEVFINVCTMVLMFLSEEQHLLYLHTALHPKIGIYACLAHLKNRDLILRRTLSGTYLEQMAVCVFARQNLYAVVRDCGILVASSFKR